MLYIDREYLQSALLSEHWAHVNTYFVVGKVSRKPLAIKVFSLKSDGLSQENQYATVLVRKYSHWGEQRE